MTRDQEELIRLENERPVFRARILYIEDDMGLGRLLQKRLERMACKVDVAGDGLEGLRTFGSGVYDLVITDYNMPGANGIEVLRRLKDVVPVIILTGLGDEKVAVEAMKLGAADYVSKDIQGDYIELLPSIIDRVIERQQLITDRRQARAELQASEARYRAIVEDQSEMICRFLPGGKLTFANAAFCRYFGIQQGDIGFQNLVAFLPRRAYQYLREGQKNLSTQNPVTTNTHSLKTVSGEIRWLQWTSRAIFDEAFKLAEYQLVGRDITEIKRVEEALRASEEKNTALLAAIPDPILRIGKTGTCIDVRPKKGQAIPLSSELIGQNIAKVFPPDVVELFRENIAKVFEEGIGQVFQFQLGDGELIRYQEARLAPAGNEEVLAILRDVTERSLLEQQLQYLSIHDSLTGLYNRAYFAAEVKRIEIGRQRSTGVVVCDVDGLKMVNDNLGHTYGDKILKAAADTLAQTFRGGDAVARIGGDEFAVLLPNATKAILDEACERLRKNLACYNRAKPELFISISVGAALQDASCPELGDALKQADEAMYADKLRHGKEVRDAIAQKLRELLARTEPVSPSNTACPPSSPQACPAVAACIPNAK